MVIETERLLIRKMTENNRFTSFMKRIDENISNYIKLIQNN